jgi:hypothetical protein
MARAGFWFGLASIVVGATMVAATAMLRQPWLNLAVCAIAAGIAILRCWRMNQAGLVGGATVALHTAKNARHVGLIWAWAALSMALVYGAGILRWHEWWHFVLAFGFIAALSLGLAGLLASEVDTSPILAFARRLGAVQGVGMLAAVAGMAFDGKLLHFERPDWGAHNIFLSGAIAVGLSTLVAFATERRLVRASSAVPGS